MIIDFYKSYAIIKQQINPMIIFTKHALSRMEERSILRSDIEKVIENPDYIQRENHRIIFHKKLNNKILEVVLVKENNKTIILTCYYL